MSDFCHLHIHGEHSILDGYTKTTDIPKVASELGQTKIGLTDHGTLSGSLPFWKSAKEAEVGHIFGVEAYVTPDRFNKDKDSPTWHLILLAQNRQGLENLFAMSKVGWNEGFYKKPRIDYETLARYSDGIICLSACMASETARAIEARDNDAAVAALQRYAGIFPGRFYVELQPNNSSDLNHGLANFADDLGLPTTVTVDSHYDHCASKATEELLLVMQQGAGSKKSDKDYASLMYGEAKRADTMMSRLDMLWPNRGLSYRDIELHIMSRDEVVTRLDGQGFDGNALADSTLEIAERCENVEFETGNVYLPKAVKSVDSDAYLRELALDGLADRGLDSEVYLSRVDEELEVISSKGFSDYFLIVWDIINEARRRNIYVGPGRGSAAGSLVAYALRITAIDPIKYKLLFSRFMDPERDDYPDIDMDFEHTRRDEMKEYMAEKYGEKYNLSTYGRFQAKGLVRKIASALAIPLPEVNEACKHFEDLEGYRTGDAPKLKSFRKSHPEIEIYADKLEGHITNNGIHAAGVVIADRPMTKIAPVESRPNPDNKKQRDPVVAFDMWDAEEVGLIKFDFLGLSNLSIIHSCVDLIKERHDVDIDWEELEPDDPAVLESLDSSYTTGVFQMESASYRKLLGEMGVDGFSDVVASNALVRPGAFDTVAKDYIRRKKGLEKVSYPHEDAKDWLDETFGVAIYQEQVMALSVVLGGFTWGEANKLRKIIGKKRDVEEFKPFYDKWMEGAGAKIGEKEADKLWHDFEKHANYSFNKSHSVSYSYIGYVTAYLKHYYPLEYMFALLKHEEKAANKMAYLLEAKRMGIEILGPDVNKSEAHMSVDGNALRFGLADIKMVGMSAFRHIEKLRPFTDWDDWNARIKAQKCNSRVVESLVAVDALRSVEGAPYNSRPEENYMEYLNYPVDLESVGELGIEFSQIEDYEEGGPYIVVCGVTKNIKRTDRYMRLDLEDMSGTLTCFGDQNNDLSDNEMVIALIGDKSMIGYARVSGLGEREKMGNLDPFEKLLLNKGFEDFGKLRAMGIGGVGDPKSLVMPLSVRTITTKTGKKMAFTHMTDGETVVKITLFPADWEKYQNLVERYRPICVKLKLLDGGDWTIQRNGLIDAVKLLEQQKEKEYV